MAISMAIFSGCGGGGIINEAVNIKTECDWVDYAFRLLNEMHKDFTAVAEREGINSSQDNREHMFLVYDAMSTYEKQDFENKAILFEILEATRRYHTRGLGDWNQKDLENCPNFNKVRRMANSRGFRFEKILREVKGDYNTKEQFIAEFPSFPKNVLEHFSFLFEN